jgi:hypothetical protein
MDKGKDGIETMKGKNADKTRQVFGSELYDLGEFFIIHFTFTNQSFFFSQYRGQGTFFLLTIE